MTSSTTKFYGISVSYNDWREDHNYCLSDVFQLMSDDNKPVTNRNEAIATAAKLYPPNDANGRAWVAYYIVERITVTVESTINGLPAKHTTFTEEYFFTNNRSYENWAEFVELPRLESLKHDEASGETAAMNAYVNEVNENRERLARGEAPVHTAEIAWLRFKGHSVPDHLLEKVEKRNKFDFVFNIKPQNN